MNVRHIAFFWVTAGAFTQTPAKKETPPAEAAEAAELNVEDMLKKGRAAFDAHDYPAAEKFFDQLVADFGENPEVAPLIDECRPMLAMCKVKRGAFDEALTLIDVSLKNKKLPEAAREELSFWRGICLMRTDDIKGAQEQFGAYFANEKHDRTRRYESFLLFASGYIQLDDFAGAADFLAEQIPKLPLDQREVGGRATVLLLHSLAEAGRQAEALALVRRTFPQLSELTQVVSFQLLTLSLGVQFLADEKPYEAIACLNRLWPRERLRAHQRQRLEEWKAKRERLRAEGARREALVFQIDGIVTRIERELEQFEKIESYDAALQLRLAQAFIELQRWREAGMMLDAAVAALPPDKTLEKAAMTAIDCWAQISAHERAAAAADRYVAKFKDEADGVPRALFAKAEAWRGSARMEEAEKLFGDIANDFAKHALAPRAMLMGGICQLETDRSEAALETFAALRRRFKKGPLHEDATFWEGMGLSFQKQYPAARDRLAEYLQAYPNGRYAGDAAFERARCLHNQSRHAEASAEFRTLLKKYTDNRHVNEARLLHGESLMAEGEMESGLKSLAAIEPAEERLWEEAQFKTGDALRKLNRLADARKHYEQFVAARPRSLRLAEAALWQSRLSQQMGEPDAAKKLAWDTLAKLGDDPRNEGVEDLLTGLDRLYGGKDEKLGLQSSLESKAKDARRDGKKTLAVRLTWARGQFVRMKSPDEARQFFFALKDDLDVRVHHPRIIADCADAWRETGGWDRAAELYRSLRKWHPRALEKERASFGLGMAALAKKAPDEAMDWFEKCIRESVTGGTGNEALLEKAVLLRTERKTAEAAATLEKVTGSRLAAPQQKARALLELGRCALAAGDWKKAAAHFQRCALSGAKFKAMAAEARLQHGLALEKLGDKTGAAAAYRELLAKADLERLPPAKAARERLREIGGGAL